MSKKELFIYWLFSMALFIAEDIIRKRFNIDRLITDAIICFLGGQFVRFISYTYLKIKNR